MTDETTHIARQAAALDEAQKITMTYRNWRGEVGTRTIQPWGLRFGTTEWHPEPGWLLEAWDFDKGAVRDFALADCQFADLGRPSLAGDERVARLVDAARPFVTAMDLAKAALRQHPDVGHLETLAALYTGWTDRKELRAALSAMNTPAQGGEECGAERHGARPARSRATGGGLSFLRPARRDEGRGLTWAHRWFR